MPLRHFNPQPLVRLRLHPLTFATTLAVFEFWNGTEWKSLCDSGTCGGGTGTGGGTGGDTGHCGHIEWGTPMPAANA